MQQCKGYDKMPANEEVEASLKPEERQRVWQQEEHPLVKLM